MRRAPGDREQQVLEALIQLFIERREPVSSRMLEESGRLEIRSASIRAVMHELERKGYLSAPHTSAGRVPTDEGYRAYVDELLPADEAVEPLMLAEVERALAEAGADLRQLLLGVARVLGRLSQNIAILVGPREKSPRVTGIDLYQRDSAHVFVVVSLEGGSTRTELIRLDRSIVPESIMAASTILGERLCGRALDELRHDLERVLESSASEPGTELAREVLFQARGLFDPDGLLQFTFEGVSEALEQPEFADPNRLKALLELMSRGQAFENALEEFVRTVPGEVSLAIGRENPLPALHPFSLLATRFELSDQYGFLAILGPRRMRYAQTVALVRAIASHLERMRV